MPGDGGTRLRLFAKMAAFLQDGGAHKSTWHCRGDGASKFCLLCKNLFTESSSVCDEDGTNLLRCNVIKKSGLVPAAGKDLRRSARYLAAKVGTIPPGDFTELQQALGLTHHPHSILLDRALDDIVDPVANYFHDFMHGLFVDGVCNITVYLVLEAFIVSGMSDVYTQLSSYIGLWDWPGRIYSNQLPDIFAESRKDKHRKAHHIKCQASDMLSLVPVLAMFVLKILLPRKTCDAACFAFVALANVVEFIWFAARGGAGSYTVGLAGGEVSSAVC